MAESLRHVVADGEAGVRFDRVVAALAEVSRARASDLVSAGMALLDGEPSLRSTRVAAGQVVNVASTPTGPGLRPANVPFAVAYEDDVLLVVDKPAGVVVHPGAGHHHDTLINGLVGRFPELADLGERQNWGLVHRIDRGTSGLLIVARNIPTREALQESLRRRLVTRRYLALAAGRRFDNATGTIEAPIGRDPHRPTRMAVVADGRSARTNYERLAAWDDVTLLRVMLDTGRTHQIRVHFAAIDAPLVGDSMYGAASSLGLASDRVWLHAAQLTFAHPSKGKEVHVDSRLPDELTDVLAGLGVSDVGEVPTLPS